MLEMKALVIDDSRVMRNMVMQNLQKTRLAVFEFVEAGDGAEGLTKYKPDEIDICFVDWNMPNMDGYAVLKALRRSEGGHHPKILFCTTENDVGAIARALHAGADEYIMKPFDRDILRDKLEQVGLEREADAA